MADSTDTTASLFCEDDHAVGLSLRPYHLSWLSSHPDRTARWLKDMLLDGFDVHHVDGDHSNDASDNLVLMDAVDHMRMHGPRLRDGIALWRRNLGFRSAQAKEARNAADAANRAAPPVAEAPHLADVRAYVSRAGRS